MLRLAVKNLRAVSDAAIELKDITVLSGVNACGKSTLSKTLYHILHTAINFDDLQSEIYSQQISNLFFGISRTFREGLNRLPSSVIAQSEKLKILAERKWWLRTSVPSHDDVRGLLNAIQRYMELVDKSNSSSRSKQWFFAGLKRYMPDLTTDEADGEQIVEALTLAFSNIEAEFNKKLAKRPLSFLNNIIEQSLQLDRRLKNEVDVVFQMPNGTYESLLDIKQQRLQTPPGVDRIFYIDTPWVIDAEDTNVEDDRLKHRKHLIQSLTSRESSHFSSQIDISNIINGNVERDENSIMDNDFKFKTLSGIIFDLFQCATGIKSFSILQILLRKGLLDDGTVLVIDEPEAHLHPQWVVEYARLITLLNKHLGVRFFISTHSPDMVQAIQASAEEADKNESTLFYLASKSKNHENTFQFDALGFDIAPIFKSFNVALSKISGETAYSVNTSVK